MNCSFDGCDRLAGRLSGLCKAHYRQQWQGKPLSPINASVRPRGTPPRIEYDEVPCPNPSLVGPCHVFRGDKSRRYGAVKHNGRVTLVHRYVWEQANGQIPDGLQIDHQCRNRGCCNVAHLRLVTAKINSTENVVGIGWQRNAAQTHCRHGHPFDDANTHWSINEHGNARRSCRVCARIKSAQYRREKSHASH